MNNMKWRGFALIAATLVLAGCDRANAPTGVQPTSPPTSVVPSASTASSETPSTPDPAQAWTGRWIGPEGTYLQLDAAGPGQYEVRIKDLDAERKFAGVSKDGVLRFERDGKSETLQPTDGDATGMKWLAGKKTCLTVRAGEGYCRD